MVILEEVQDPISKQGGAPYMGALLHKRRRINDLLVVVVVVVVVGVWIGLELPLVRGSKQTCTYHVCAKQAGVL